MSTRCNILIKSGSTNIWLYRHCDGYLSETGYNLASTLSHCNGFKNFLDNLLNQKYESYGGHYFYDIDNKTYSGSYFYPMAEINFLLGLDFNF